MVNKVLVLKNHHGIMQHKHKQECQGQNGNNSKHQVGTPSAGPIQHPHSSNPEPSSSRVPIPHCTAIKPSNASSSNVPMLSRLLTRGAEFSTNLIILDLEGIDVILGMD
jgi:hypothetical protein